MRLFRSVRPPVGAAVAAALLALCACGSGSGGASAASATTPVSGGSVTYAVDTEPVCFDAHVSQQDITGEIDRNVVDSLVSEDSSGNFHPWLATSWSAAPDLTSYTFHLRQGVTFTDGTPFNADAVKANFDSIVAPATKSQYAASLLGPYTGTKVIDPYTVEVDFSQPFAPFLQAASTAYLGFYSPKALAAAGSAGLCAGGPALVGTGPFVFTSYTKGQSAVLTKNPAYQWGPGTAAHTGPAYLNQVTFRFLPDDATRVGTLTSGQSDLARALPPANVGSVKADSSLQVLTRSQPGAVYSLVLNTTKAPLNDQKVREAVQRGINIDQDVKSVYFGVYQRAWSPLSPSTPGYDASLENSWPYDPALANQLLDQDGWTGRDAQGYRTKDGQTLSIEWPLLPTAYITDQRDTLGQAIQADLKKIGVQVTRPQWDIGTYISRVYGGQEGIADTSWSRFEPDVLWLFFNSASAPAKGGQNGTFLADPQLDQWTNQARATSDPATRAQLYAQVQQRVISLAIDIPVYVPETIIGANKDVHGITFDPNDWVEFYDTWVTR